MARRPRIFAPGLLYHVVVRGNHRQRTFRSPADYQAYLDRLASYRKRCGVRIYAYCLMPNHVHLLLETATVPLGRFMQGLQQSYTQYFNRAHRQVGHLFQGRYHAIVCEKERYLLALLRYIHLNPVRAKLVRAPEQYRYSGHAVYLRGAPSAILDPAPVLGLLGGRGAYRRFMRAARAEGHQAQYYAVADQRFLGDEGFAQALRASLGQEEQPRPKRSLEKTLLTLARHVGLDPARLRSPDRGWAVSRRRSLIAYTLIRRLGFPLSRVAAHVGRDAATVSVLISRLAVRMQDDPAIRRDVEVLTKIV